MIPKWSVITGVAVFLLGSLLIFWPALERPLAQVSAPTAAEVEPNATEILYPTVHFSSSAGEKTLIEAFASRQVAYFAEDQITAFPDPSLGLGSVITARRALPVTVREGRRSVVYRTWQRTVGDFLTERLIEIGPDDRINFAIATPLGLDMTVEVTRVAHLTITETETIPFQSIKQDDPSSWRGSSVVTQRGQLGQREKKFFVTREDGLQISKVMTANKVVSAPVNQITKIGTKIKIGQTFQGIATYYTNSYGTKVAIDKFKRGVEVRVTNLNNGKQIIVRNDGCICGNDRVLIDLNPEYFKQLGGTLAQGVLSNIRVEEILN